MDHVGALQLLDGNEEFLTSGSVIVIVVAEHLGTPFLADDIAVLIYERALVGIGLGDDDFGKMTIFVEGVFLTTAVIALDGHTATLGVKEGGEVDGLAFAFALFEAVTILWVKGISVVHYGLVALVALDGGLGQQTLVVEGKHVVALAAVGHDDMLVNTPCAAVEAHVKVLDAVTVCRIVHQVAVEQFNLRVDGAHGIHVGGQALEGGVLAAIGVSILGAHAGYHH